MRVGSSCPSLYMSLSHRAAACCKCPWLMRRNSSKIWLTFSLSGGRLSVCITSCITRLFSAPYVWIGAAWSFRSRKMKMLRLSTVVSTCGLWVATMSCVFGKTVRRFGIIFAAIGGADAVQFHRSAGYPGLPEDSPTWGAPGPDVEQNPGPRPGGYGNHRSTALAQGLEATPVG